MKSIFKNIKILTFKFLNIYIFKFVVVFALFIFCANTTSAATISKPTNYLGMIGYWTFDGKDMTPNVRDVSGSGNHGKLTNFTSTTTAPGKVGQALLFDGVDDKMDTGSDFINTNAVSACLWLKPSYLVGNNSYFIDNGSFRLNAGTSANRVSLSSNGSVTSINTTGGSLELNKWVFICATRDASGNGVIYMDGVSKVSGSTGTPVAGTNVCIGNRCVTSASRGTGGAFDDVRIYNRALSATEIRKLYDKSTTKFNSSSGALSQGLVGYWTFDGINSSTTIADISGEANHGYFIGGATSTAKTIGRIGQALRFDGSSTYVNIPDTSDVEGQSQLSISVWVKNDNSANVTAGDTIISKEGSGADTFYLTWAQAEDIEFCIVGTAGTSCGGAGAASAVFADGIPVGGGKNWYHIVGTYDSVAGQVKVYVNGVLGDTVGSLSTLTQNSSHPIKIGTTWPGIIDDVRIYNRSLSVSEIKQLYNMGGSKINKTPTTKANSGLIGHWTFDGKDMTPNVRDVSGSGNHGFILGQTSTTTMIGKIGQALKFDGVDDRVKIANIIASNTSNLTVSFWMKSNTTANPGVPVSKARAAAETTGSWGFSRNSGGQMQFYVTNSTPAWNQATKNGYADTLWHHVVGTYDGTTVRLYVDGQAGASAALSGTIQTASSYPVCIGSNNADSGGTCNGDEFNGIVDDVRIFNRTLSETEIAQLYKIGR